MNRLLLICFVLSTNMKKLLDVKDVTRTSIGACLHDKADKLRHVLVGKHGFDNFNGCINDVLFTEEKETKTQSKDSGEWMFQIFLFFF